MRIYLLTALTLSGCFASLVNGECADGYVTCGNECVLAAAPCAAPGTPDASMADGGTGTDAAPGSDARPDARPDAGPGPDAALGPDAGVLCSLGFEPCASGCVDTVTDDANCGGCGNVCTTGLTCSAGVCCGDMELGCRGACIDPLTDPDNCGGCGISCTSGICQAGACTGAPTGHLIVIGHDYVKPRLGMNRLLGNSVFLARSPTVTVAGYAGDATAAAMTGSEAAITQVQREIGRNWQRNIVDGDGAAVAMATSDVFLVYAQSSATAAALDALAVRWAVPMAAFLARGGIVIILEGNGAETHRVVGVQFSAPARNTVTGTVMTVSAPFDAVAADVPMSYLGEIDSVSFPGAVGPSVVVSPAGDSVVVHKRY
jgi:hypothetical protein